jgi:hypothetical protein
MSLITLKFSSRMATAALEGRKICTSRDEQKGRAGDEFEIQGVRFRIIDVGTMTLQNVREHFYRLEGCESPEDFEILWRSLHRRNFSAEKVYFVHFFARCPE